MFEVVWISSMPRSGSMWTYNVVRELVRRSGYRVLPEDVALSDRDCAEYFNHEMPAHRGPGTVFVLKMHACLTDIPPSHFVITNVRDIRDAVVSYMRLMHVGFDDALEYYGAFTGIADHYVGLPDERRMVIRYDEMTSAPAEIVRRIAERLSLPVNHALVEDVTVQFSKEKVAALIESKDRQVRDLTPYGRLPEGQVLLDRADGVAVTVDRSTGFQSGHVSNYQDGTWRDLLSDDEAGALDQTFGEWLTRHGYAA